MAQAFDTGTYAQAVTATSLTFAHSTSGTDRLLFVMGHDNNSASTSVTGITFNSVAMTSLVGGQNHSTDRYISIWGLIAPATGSNNVVVSASSSVSLRFHAISYTGTKQSGLPDSTSSTLNVTSTYPTDTITTVADNCWALMFGKDTAGSETYSSTTGDTMRLASDAGGHFIVDTGGPITPAGANTLTLTSATARNNGVLTVSFAPSGITQAISATAQATAGRSSQHPRTIATTAQATASMIRAFVKTISATAQASTAIIRSITHAISATAQATAGLASTIVTPIVLAVTAQATTVITNIAINAITLAVTAQATVNIGRAKSLVRTLTATAQATAGLVKSGIVIMRSLAVTAGATIGIGKGLVLSKMLATTARAVTTILTDWGYIDKYPENDTTYSDKYPES